MRRLRARSTLANARSAFLDALADIDLPQVRGVVVRMTAARTLQELWLFRADIFNLVSRQHSQTEANRRLAGLSRHAPGAHDSRSQAPLGSEGGPR